MCYGKDTIEIANFLVIYIFNEILFNFMNYGFNRYQQWSTNKDI